MAETEERPPCRDGEHIPVIIHRTGGPDVRLKNTCGKCGRMIQNALGVWMLDEKRENAAPVQRKPPTRHQ